MATLVSGPHYNGSIIIATAPPSAEAKVTVDTGIVPASLPPGNYFIVAFDPSNPKIRVQIPFQVRSVPTALRPKAQASPRSNEPQRHDALGRTEKGHIHRRVYPKP